MTQKRRRPRETEDEIGVMQLDLIWKIRQGSSGARAERDEDRFLSGAFRGSVTANNLILDFGFQNCKRINFWFQFTKFVLISYSNPKKAIQKVWKKMKAYSLA